MTVLISRRKFAALAGAVFVTGCVQGKLVHTIEFEISRSAAPTLSDAIAAYAAANRFKLAGASDETGQYWPIWTLTSDDIDLQIAPRDETPADTETAVEPDVLVYAARFYDHTPMGGAARLADVVAAFTRMLAGIDGVRKIENDQPS